MLSLIVVSIAVVYLLRVCCKRINRFCKSKKQLQGKTVLVTGGTSGIGLQASIDFASRGAKVIIACPFQTEGANAKKDIVTRTGNENIVFKPLDLSSLQSVRDFAADILKTESRLDILVNNAGVGTAGDFETKDGMNFIMQVNYYGHFLLTMLLLPLLKNTGTAKDRSRIVFLSSLAHRFAMGDVTKYNKTRYYWFQFFIYSNSKFCFLLFARKLSEMLKGTDVVVNCVDPGLVATTIYNSVNRFFGATVCFLINLFFKNQWEGAQTTLHVALDEEAGNVSGEYFVNCRLSRARDMAYDKEKAQYLWKESAKLVHLSDKEVNILLH